MKRLDLMLVQKGFFQSRGRAKEAILAGRISVNGKVAHKPALSVPKDALLEIRGPDLPYPSRAGLKLERALAVFSVQVQGLTAIDVGASTGGFTSCLLQNGARQVYAVDVGRDQLVPSLRGDQRVVVLEKTNIRHLRPEHLFQPADLATIDVSFISLTKVIPAVVQLLLPSGQIIALVKPQFETNGAGLNKRGVIVAESVLLWHLPRLMEKLQSENLALKGFSYSPLAGSKGNVEFLAHFQKGEPGRDAHSEVVQAIKEGWHFHRGR